MMVRLERSVNPTTLHLLRMLGHSHEGGGGGPKDPGRTGEQWGLFQGLRDYQSNSKA
jgi:hypothetical protein